MNLDGQPVESIISGGLTLRFFVVPWDSEVFGYPVVQIESIEVAIEGDPSPAVAEFDAWLTDHDVQLVSCRLPSLKLRESMLLESVGFRFVEMVFSPVLAPLPVDDDGLVGIIISGPEQSDQAELERIAASVFTTGRHLLDWRLDPDASHRRYRQWLRGALADEHQEVLKAEMDGATVGFFIAETRPDFEVYWHLTAVAPEWQGRGVGKRLWRTMIARHRAAGAQRIATTISAHNIPVLNLYAGLGFRFASPRATFHWQRP